MPEYTYGCDHKEHPRANIAHGMLDNPILECEVCGGRLHRIPQRFLWGFNPLSLVSEWSQSNRERKKRGEPRKIMYNDVTTDRGIPQRDYKYRR
jgi:hypothetical protein